MVVGRSNRIIFLYFTEKVKKFNVEPTSKESHKEVKFSAFFSKLQYYYNNNNNY